MALCSRWNWISLLYQHRDRKRVPISQLVSDPLKNKKFPHGGWIVLFIFWTWPFADKQTDCAPGLYSLQKEIFFPLSLSLFLYSYLTFVASIAAISLTAGRHPLPLKLHASNNSVQFNHQTIMENPAWGFKYSYWCLTVLSFPSRFNLFNDRG